MAPSSISRSRKAVLRARWSETEIPSVVAMAMRAEFMKAYGNSWRGSAVGVGHVPHGRPARNSAQRRDDPQRALGTPVGHPAAQRGADRDACGIHESLR